MNGSDQLPENFDSIAFFRESSPYIHAHRDNVFVILLPGKAYLSENFANIIHDIALLNSLGIRIVIVYDAALQTKQRCEKLGINTASVEQRPIVDKNFLELTKDALGNLRFEIEVRLSMGVVNSPMHGSRISVVGGNFLTAKPLGVVDGVDFQHTGEIRRIDHKAIKAQLELNNVVLLPNIGSSPTGELFYLESEQLSAEIAVSLGADKLLMLGEEKGLRDKNQEQIRILTPRSALLYLPQINDPQIASLLEAAIYAGETGVRRSHLLSYQINGAILREIFTRDGCGTMVTDEAFDQIREASIDDVQGILELIQPLENKGVLVRRSRKQLERDISQFMLAERDGMIIGCAALNPFSDGHSAELSCVAVHPDYRNSNKGGLLLEHIENKARQKNYKKLFALTTKTEHWFKERGFSTAGLNSLPKERQSLYNLQRNSKIFIKGL